MQTTLKCPHCGKMNTITKAGHQRRAGKGMIQQYGCKSCGRTTTQPIIVPRNDNGRFITAIPTQSTSTVPNMPI
jgi:predicted RNA-binding Zn-ribbon protein involved in translation (DUF1610 family)